MSKIERLPSPPRGRDTWHCCISEPIGLAGQERDVGPATPMTCRPRLDNELALQRGCHGGENWVFVQRFFPGIKLSDRVGAMHCDLFCVM